MHPVALLGITKLYEQLRQPILYNSINAKVHVATYKVFYQMMSPLNDVSIELNYLRERRRRTFYSLSCRLLHF